jgi:hypothetical protein
MAESVDLKVSSLPLTGVGGVHGHMDQEIAYLKFNFIFPLLKKFISENNLEG